MTTFIPDESQLAAIQAQGGYHLVLAPPGCGKTQILTERIRFAHERGIDYADMLCLTFTNRAARSMAQRVDDRLGVSAMDELYVGNVHRFCSRFLFNENIVPASTAIIDDDDAISILARHYNADEENVRNSYNLRKHYAKIVHLAAFVRQLRSRHPKPLRLHPECITSDDIASMKVICDLQAKPFDREAMLDMYDHPDFYADIVRKSNLDLGQKTKVGGFVDNLDAAKMYADYKRLNGLLDFEDLLLSTYDALAGDIDGQYKRYRWVQVDEVQDLNPMQMGIVDLLTAHDPDTVMFLGDEQQAIFSFMGAKITTLNKLKLRCRYNLHRLMKNHRSPSALLEVFNEYAEKMLKIPRQYLPDAAETSDCTICERLLLRCDTKEEELLSVARLAQTMLENGANETTAIIVNSNADAETMSRQLTDFGVSHFKVSGNDMFATDEMKLLLAHFGVLDSSINFLQWARILHGTRVFETKDLARRFIRASLDDAIQPSDYIVYGGETTYTQDFISHYDDGIIVVFDTETTGLNVFEDDIIQIAAVKMRRGEVLPDSKFCLYIATERPIPKMLGDIPNPIIAEMNRHKLHNHDEALRSFMNYAAGCTLLAHNIDFDYNILRNNLQRFCPDLSLPAMMPKYFDTLRLARLLEPRLRSYKLKMILEKLHLEGSNTHLADDDVAATVSLVHHCRARAAEKTEIQRQFMSHSAVKKAIKTLCENYADTYLHSFNAMYNRPSTTGRYALVDELQYVYEAMLKAGFIRINDKMDYFLRFLSNDVMRGEEGLSLAEQVGKHAIEMNTFKEADLCNSRSIDDRVFVTTIHKAKGLEFDNVIAFDMVDGRIPNAYNSGINELLAEDARKFYVAISRAKRRLIVTCSDTSLDREGRPRRIELTRFMTPILRFFSEMRK